MPHNWRAPACYVSVALICMLYIWIMPIVGLTDLFAGAGIGAALMWALNDWEIRQQARLREQGVRGEAAASALASRLRGVMRAGRERGEEAEPLGEAPPREDGMRRLARAAGALERDGNGEPGTPPRPEAKPAGRQEAKPARHQEATPVGRQEIPIETPIATWRREVLMRDIARMEAQLRALEAPDEEPFGAPERTKPEPPRRELPDRWQRPARSRSGSR